MGEQPRATCSQPRFLRLRSTLAAIVLLPAILCLQGCTTIVRPNVAAPVFQPPAGTYTAAFSVTITDSNSEAVIHYTTDGSVPSATSPVYSSPLSITATTTVEAIAVFNGSLISNPVSALYTIQLPQAATPVISPPSGKYATPILITITDATPGATIYFTNGNSTPTTSSPVYTGPIPLDHSDTINAVAIAPGYSLSNVATATYTIGQGYGVWTWMGGGNGTPIGYGTLGVPDPANFPTGRQGSVSWTDKSGNFWMFGGEESRTSEVEMNDLWEYSPSTNQWTWQSGSQTPNQPSVHVAAGVADPSNVPWARQGAYGWTDASGNLWLFGGNYTLPSGQGYYLNDLWKFNPATKLWTWYGGNPVEFPIGVYGSKGVPSPGNTPGGRNNGVAWTDAAGNFWLLGGFGVDTFGSTGYLNDLWTYSPSTSQWTWIGGKSTAFGLSVYGTQGVASPSNTPGGIVQDSVARDATGHAWVYGGVGETATDYGNFLSTFWKFDQASTQWTWVDGAQTRSQPGTYGIKGVPSPLNIPGARITPYSWADLNNNIWLFGGNSWDADYINDLWKFDPSLNQWIWESGSNQPNSPTVFGVRGVPDPANIPGGRQGGITWTDSSGALWLFGGTTNTSVLNELWRYQP